MAGSYLHCSKDVVLRKDRLILSSGLHGTTIMRIAFRPNTTLITGPAKVVSASILTPSEEQQANKELALINADYSEPSTTNECPKSCR